MYRMCVIVNLFFSVQVFAGPTLIVPEVECPTKKLYNKIDFYTEEFIRTIEGVGNVEPASQATFEYYKTPKDPYKASGFFVSKEGHFLSVLHGFEECLVKTGHLEELEGGDVKRTSKPYPVSCTFYEKDGKEKNITVYDTGKCVSCDKKEDFVLGKVENAKSNCAKLRTTKGPQIGESVVATGFPVETKNRQYNSQEGVKNFSVGEVVGNSPITCVLIKKEKGEGWKAQVVPTQIYPGMQRITADLIFGNSGGPVTDKNGDVIGVAAYIVINETQLLDKHRNESITTREMVIEGWECKGNSYMIPITDILERAAMRLPSQTLEKFLECEP